MTMAAGNTPGGFYSNRRLARTGCPVRVLDVMEAEGGWLTTRELEALLPQWRPGTIQRAVHRLVLCGLAERRPYERGTSLTAFRLSEAAKRQGGVWASRVNGKRPNGESIVPIS